MSKEAKAAIKRAGDYERWLEKQAEPPQPDYEHEDKLSAKEMYDDDKRGEYLLDDPFNYSDHDPIENL